MCVVHTHSLRPALMRGMSLRHAPGAGSRSVLDSTRPAIWAGHRDSTRLDSRRASLLAAKRGESPSLMRLVDQAGHCLGGKLCELFDGTALTWWQQTQQLVARQ